MRGRQALLTPYQTALHTHALPARSAADCGMPCATHQSSKQAAATRMCPHICTVVRARPLKLQHSGCHRCMLTVRVRGASLSTARGALKGARPRHTGTGRTTASGGALHIAPRRSPEAAGGGGGGGAAEHKACTGLHRTWAAAQKSQAAAPGKAARQPAGATRRKAAETGGHVAWRRVRACCAAPRLGAFCLALWRWGPGSCAAGI